MESNFAGMRETTHVTVVGGGIGGLYAAYLLAHVSGYSVEVLDLARGRLGGRIATRKVTLKDAEFVAEFGPMRFEIDLQMRFRRLCQHLGIGFIPFSATGSPKILSEYEMTDVEASFESAADLHKWAVLKMFFSAEKGEGSECLPGSHDVGETLKSIEEAHSLVGTRSRIGPEQLRWLQCYLDERLFLGTVDGKRVPLPCEEMERNLDELRAEQSLRGESDGPLLRDIGLWHALSEVVTPGAVAKIRDSGTFYHCIVNNPSAVEWGIFWLRQASTLGTLWTFDEHATEGVWTLVQRLLEKLQVHQERGTVSIRTGREVVQVEPAKRPAEVVLRIMEHNQSGDRSQSYSLRTDHVILALPQWPLRRLLEHFPQNVTERINGVEALPLLKAFVVTRKPWWQPHLAAQSYAWQVPTRELHFYRGEKADCPSLRARVPGRRGTGCNCCSDDGPGMVMLYADQPGISYWDGLVPSDARMSVLWRGPGDCPPLDPVREVEDHSFELLDLLIRRLLVIPHPGLAYMINSQKQKFFAAALARRPGMPPASASRLTVLLEKLDASDTDEPGRHRHLLGFSECIAEISEDDSDRELVSQVLEDLIPALPEKWLEYLRKTFQIRNRVIEREEVREEAEDVIAYGIRDWSAEPFGGAAHLWMRRFCPEPVASDPLLAFSLRERANGPLNVHICGEAFSGNQGFIEGALQTAEHVVSQIIGRDAFEEVIGEVLKPSDATSARKFEDDCSARLAAEWQKRISEITKGPHAP